jgi:ABC-type dipeptide/oligopeptide/nickel transport system permease subunit
MARNTVQEADNPLLAADDAPALAAQRGRRASQWKTLTSNKTALAGAVYLTLMVMLAIFAPLVAPHDPVETNLIVNFSPPMFFGGTSEHVLGTDQLGRDMLSRIIYGSRVSMIVGGVTVVIAGTIGVVFGLVAGYFRGITDDVVSWLTDVLLAFPFILLAIAVMAVIGGGLLNVIIVLAATRWVDFSRVVRGETMSVESREYVVAARAIGASSMRVVFRHALPNVITPVIVIATFAVAQMIVSEASLSFLGVGVQPPTPTWGGMLSDSRTYLGTAWWMSVFPGAAIMLTVLSVNFLGDWVRDTLDPRLNR